MENSMHNFIFHNTDGSVFRGKVGFGLGKELRSFLLVRFQY